MQVYKVDLDAIASPQESHEKLPIDCSDHVAAHPLGAKGHRSTPAFVCGVGGIKLTGADNSGNPTWPTQGLTK